MTPEEEKSLRLSDLQRGGGRKGVKCPKCDSVLSDVVRTWRVSGAMRRARRCVHCGAEWDTTETGT